MALSEFETRRCEKLVAAFVSRSRPPLHVRSEVDVAFRVRDQSVELFEIRPAVDDPGARIELPFAKATWNRSRGHWKVFWQRADRAWHPYLPRPHVATLEEFPVLIEADAHACFRG